MKNSYVFVKSKLISFEEKWNLFELEINDVKIWQYIRFKVFQELFIKLKLHDNIHYTDTHKSRYFKAVINNIKFIFQKRSAQFSKKENVDILVFNHSRKKYIDGEYSEIYTDLLLKEANFTYQVIEIPSFTHYPKISKLKSTRYLDTILFLLNALFQKIKNFHIIRKDLEKLNLIQDDLEREFNVKIDLIMFIKKILLKRKAYSWVLNRIIKKYSPQIVLEIVGYEDPKLILNELCKQKKITTIELQHGIFDPLHLAYDYPHNVDLDIFPDYLFTFGKFWDDACSFPIPKERIIPVGFPFFEQEFAKYQKFKVKEKNQILFISQGSIGKELGHLAYEFSKISDKKILFKLHPSEIKFWERNNYFIPNPKIEVIKNDQKPLYQLFLECSTIVGVSSTAVFEALMFGGDIYIYTHPSYVKLESLIKKKYVQLISSAEELFQKIESKKGKVGDLKIEGNQLFMDNGIENQKRELGRILEKIKMSKK